MISEQKEKRILLLSFTAGLAFAITELIFSILSHSQSVLMDAMYDASELIFIILILFLTPLFYKPISEKHPYGFFQIESIFLIIKCSMMLTVTCSVAIEIIESILVGGGKVNELHISIFQFVLGVASIIIFFIMKNMNSSVSSPTVRAELIGWKIDILYSIGMSIAFFASMFLENTPLYFISPYFDQIMAIIVIILTIPDSIKILWGAIKDVFLFSPDEEIVNQIKDICSCIMEEINFKPVFFDITKTGRHMWISVYFKIDNDLLDTNDLKKASDKIKKEVNNIFENSTCELIIIP